VQRSERSETPRTPLVSTLDAAKSRVREIVNEQTRSRIERVYGGSLESLQQTYLGEVVTP
jgi:hypothetical protein